MRMWMVNPQIMCRQHLLGEHSELHMFIGSLQKRKNLEGFFQNNCLEPRSIYERHKKLVIEMLNRGYNHKSNILLNDCMCILNLPIEKQYWEINKELSLKLLLDRCPECRKNYSNLNNNLEHN